MTTQDVLNHHLGAFGTGNVDQIIKDYQESSVAMSPDASLRGINAIRDLYAGAFGDIFKPGTYELITDRMEIEGDVAYVVWHGTTSAGELRIATETFVIRDGKIAVQTFTMHLEPN